MNPAPAPQQPTTVAPTAGATSRGSADLLGPLTLVALVLLVHGNVLFGDGETMLSLKGNDLQTQFVPWRSFGFREMAQGNVPLWNPHNFSGTPYVGSWQSALFYPPNWLFLVLPVGHALNWSVALHVAIAGLGTYLWARMRGVSAAGATIAGAVYMFGAPYSMHVAAGHATFLCVAAWTPVVFLVADRFLDGPTLRWGLVGACAVALQILGGYPQPVYVTALAASLYLGLNLAVPPLRESVAAWRARRSGRTIDVAAAGPGRPSAVRRAGAVVAAWTGVYAGAALLAAIQIGPAISTAAESGRSGPVPYTFASIGPLPPENLLTLVVPGLFGDMVRSRYVGRWFAWEGMPYVGAAALGLALIAILSVPSRQRRFAGTTVALVTLVALGHHTPLHHFLYDWFPGFGRFRVVGRFAAAAAPFVGLLAGMGWDRLRGAWPSSASGDAPPASAGAGPTRTTRSVADAFTGARRAPTSIAIGALCLAGAALYASLRIDATAALGSQGEWGRFMAWVGGQRDVILRFTRDLYTDDDAVRTSAAFASSQCAVAAVVLGVFGVLVLAVQRWRTVAWVLAALAVGELAWFASATQGTCAVHVPFPEAWKTLGAEIGDGRVACDDDVLANVGVEYGLDNVAGYDPVALRRYAEFMTYGQGRTDPAQIDAAVDVPPVVRVPRAFQVLRCRAMLVARPQPRALVTTARPLAHVQLVGRYEIPSGRDDMLRRVFDESFDPRSVVLLEERPTPEPVGTAGSVRVVAEGTDSLEIEADVPQPTILLVTDAYSAGWRARALEGSVEQELRVLPANHVLRAIPLAAGRHHFVLEYAPIEWTAGKWLSVVALGALLLLAAATAAKRRIQRRRAGAVALVD